MTIDVNTPEYRQYLADLAEWQETMLWWKFEYTAISVNQNDPSNYELDSFTRGAINTSGAMAEVEHMVRKKDNMKYQRVGDIIVPHDPALVGEKQFKDFIAYINSLYTNISRMSNGDGIKLATDAMQANLNNIIAAHHNKFKQLEIKFLDDRNGKRYEVHLRPPPPEPTPPVQDSSSARF